MAPTLGPFGSAVQNLVTHPFPPFLLSIVNIVSPLALPAFAVLAASYSYMHQFGDMTVAFQDPNFANPLHFDVYDFIVVGGGSAGAVVANRLSQNNRVLLLEAGGNPHPLSYIPAAVPILLSEPTVDWLYTVEPQKFASFGVRNNATLMPRGKSLGGCSILNVMIYMRGNPKDFNQWAKITGDDSWTYENLMPFFKKMETYKGRFPNESVHGNNGPIHVETQTSNPGLREWLKAAHEMGYPIKDMNAYQTEGFTPTEATLFKGSRSDTYRRYLKPILDRRSLTISRFSHVIKVHLDRQRNAYGVTYVRHGIQKFVRASKEIIISAGAINSPHLLMLSGIGPKKHLNSKGIRCRVNLPVGQNLQDHLMTWVGPITANASISLKADRDFSLSTGIDFLFNRKGPLASVISSGTAVLSSSFTDASWPDVFVHQVGFAFHQGSSPIVRVMEDIFSLKPGLLTSLYKVSETKDHNFALVSIGRPFSRGEILLRNSYPFEKPIIDPKYLSDPRDAQIMVEGIQKLLEVYQKAPTYRKMDAKVPKKALPGCEKHEFGSYAYWECYVRTFSVTIYHPCCTCRMGKRFNDTSAVIDSKFRLLKTRRLRVIDASAMSEITNANLNAPTIMMGEKGAFDIRSHWASQYSVCDKLEYFINHMEHDLKCYYTRQA